MFVHRMQPDQLQGQMELPLAAPLGPAMVVVHTSDESGVPLRASHVTCDRGILRSHPRGLCQQPWCCCGPCASAPCCCGFSTALEAVAGQEDAHRHRVWAAAHSVTCVLRHALCSNSATSNCSGAVLLTAGESMHGFRLQHIRLWQETVAPCALNASSSYLRRPCVEQMPWNGPTPTGESSVLLVRLHGHGRVKVSCECGISCCAEQRLGHSPAESADSWRHEPCLEWQRQTCAVCTHVWCVPGALHAPH